MSVMGGLLAGSAPLRGRASLELVMQPFGYRDAARFWGADHPRLAALLHAIVSGTPAYRREFVAVGEAKWGEVMGSRHLERLTRARDLLAASFDVSGCVLACYSAAGFDDSLHAGRDPRLALVTLDDLYQR